MDYLIYYSEHAKLTELSRNAATYNTEKNTVTKYNQHCCAQGISGVMPDKGLPNLPESLYNKVAILLAAELSPVKHDAQTTVYYNLSDNVTGWTAKVIRGRKHKNKIGTVMSYKKSDYSDTHIALIKTDTEKFWVDVYYLSVDAKEIAATEQRTEKKRIHSLTCQMFNNRNNKY